jgi:acetyl esterase/lipase
MTRGKRLAGAAVFLLGAALAVSVRLLLRETNVDRDEQAYRARMQQIWAGPAPGSPDPDAVPTDLDSGLLRHFFRNELESQVPYLVRFPVRGAQRAPALLILPGGGYSFRSEKLDGLDLAEWFAERGIACFVLNYRVDPHRHPVPLLDAARALRWLRANALSEHIDPRRVAVLGTSAGGHLAALLATEAGAGDPASSDPVERESSKPDLLLMAQAVVSFEQFVHEGSRRRLLGNSPEPGLEQALSVDRRVGPGMPPTFIWTSKTDEFVDYRNSELFVRALQRHGIEHEYQLFPEGPHGRGLARVERYTREWPQRTLDWLRRHGFTPEAGAAASL